METAALVFLNQLQTPLHVCRFARESWWEEYENRGCPHAELEAFAADLPREIDGVASLLETDRFWDPVNEPSQSKHRLREYRKQGLQQLVEMLRAHPAKVIAVACHYDTIMSMTRVDLRKLNCGVVVCEMVDGRYPFKVLELLPTPIRSPLQAPRNHPAMVWKPQ